MDNFDWNDIRLLLAANQEGSISKAAQALGVDQATASRRLGRLEQLAGVALFHRHKTGSVATEAGIRLLEKGIVARRSVEDFGRTLRGLSRTDPQRIVIKASEGAVSYLLMPLVMGQKVGPMATILPQLGCDLRFPVPPRIVSDQTPGHCDISLHWAPPEGDLPLASDMKVRKLASVRFAPVTSRPYGEQTGRLPEHFDDIADFDLLTVSVYDLFSGDLSFGPWNALTRGTERCLTVDWTSSIERPLRNGCGITLLPTYATLFSDDFMLLDMDIPPMHLDLWLAATPEALRNPQVRRTYDTIGKAFSLFSWS